ncbi:MAG: endonuclease/exonuclease/phosphatase family protein [Saprospiraceae bacterium]|nr:endonuclease/exonuclease/phosphatase family protein [Saprospiraceae bacterium]
MKIITWNCNMAFRKKWSALVELNPDILIIQECENESRCQQTHFIPNYNEFIWIGDNVNKGIGILSFNNYHIERSPDYSDVYKYIVPVKVTGPSTFNLFAIWAMPDKTSKSKSYVGQIWHAMQHYAPALQDPCILMGDWNSNAIWDHERKTGNHSQLVTLLQDYSILSVYHTLKQKKHGEEQEATLFFLKKKDKPFHLDYCFASTSLLSDHTSIEIGAFERWIAYSDHMPVILDNLAH